ncbi:MAG: DUF1877 family protein [Myxococcales bacterium]|nr:DUF1877 family protein [Myxococcales bacterium]
MSVTSTAYAVPPALLKKLRADNERFAALFGEDENAGPEWKVQKLEFVDFEDTHRLLRCAGYPTLRKVLDFENGNDEAFEYEGYDIQVATPAKVKKIAGELAEVTLEQVRTKGLEAEFSTDRRGTVLTAADYDEQFREIEATRDFFAAAAAAGHAVVAAAI